jgi:putative PIG3 family NAD(P)H quinone oxidoreductase
MKAIVIREPGGPEVLEMREIEAPEGGASDVRVRVRAAAVNRADLLFTRGTYPLPPGAPPGVPGLEIAGVVESVGAAVRDLAVGDRVFGLVAGGAYAELAVAHARTLARIPEAMPFTDAAAVPEAFITAWDALVEQAHLSAGDVALVHAAASGVGTAALQLVEAVGARAIGTLRSPAKLGRASAASAASAELFVAEGGRFAREVLARTLGRGADVVLDLVGGAYVAEDVACVAPGGRIVVVGTLAGAHADVDLHTLMRKRASIRGTVLASRPLEEKILAARMLADRIVPLLVRGKVRPVVDQVLPLARASEAHRRLLANETVGKIVLVLAVD